MPVKRDLNGDGIISSSSVTIEYCTGSQESPGQCKTGQTDETDVPSLFLIGGDTTDGGPIVNDVQDLEVSWDTFRIVLPLLLVLLS